MASDKIYLDYHATTPVDPRVVEVMMPYFNEIYGNVASNHSFGKAAKRACDHAREQVARCIGAAHADEIIFTSGATESNNFAIKCVAETLASKGKHIISCVTEHKSVLDTLKYLEKHGYAVTLLPVDRYGCVKVGDVERALRRGKDGVERTIMVSLMGANNEIGSLHPITEIGELLRDTDIIFHVDGAQTVGKVPLNVQQAHIDLLSLSGHKMYAPKGIGALYINRSVGECVCCYMHGGGQEFGLRAGTLAVPLVVAMGEAARLSEIEVALEGEKLLTLRKLLVDAVNSLGGVTLNGHPTARLPGNLNVSFADLDGERLLLALQDIAVSTASACTGASAGVSHVLQAIGVGAEAAASTIRFGLGRFTTSAEISRVIDLLNEAVPRLRKTQRRLKERRSETNQALGY